MLLNQGGAERKLDGFLQCSKASATSYESGLRTPVIVRILIPLFHPIVPFRCISEGDKSSYATHALEYPIPRLWLCKYTPTTTFITAFSVAFDSLLYTLAFLFFLSTHSYCHASPMFCDIQRRPSFVFDIASFIFTPFSRSPCSKKIHVFLLPPSSISNIVF